MNAAASDYDALADLFLGEDAPSVDPAQPDAPAPPSPTRSPARAASAGATTTSAPRDVVEGLMLGHLPVLASAWVPQYARLQAVQSSAPVTLVRLRGGHVEVDVVGLERPPVNARGVCRSLEEALALAAQRTTTWILRADDTDEPLFSTAGGIDRVTLLAGADDVAVAATYRTLKFLAQQRAEASADHSPALRVLIMGVDEARAGAARDKLLQAAQAFLGQPVEVAVGSHRMGVSPMVSIYRAPCALPAVELVAAVRDAIAKRTLAPTARTAPVEPTTDAPTAIAPPAVSAGTAKPDPRPARPAANGTHPANGHAKPLPAAHAKAAPKDDPGSLDLAAHVPSLTRLAFACPYAKDVQLAVDAEGHLHALARVTGDAEDPVGRLASVSAWASDHRDLIALAVPALKPIGDADDVHQHIFAEDPRALLHLIHASVSVHVLVEVKTPAGAFWAAKALN